MRIIQYYTAEMLSILEEAWKETVVFSKGGEGGSLTESKISLSEKIELFLDFLPKGGGALTYSKRVLS